MNKLFISLLGLVILVIVGFLILTSSSEKNSSPAPVDQTNQVSQNLGSQNNTANQIAPPDGEAADQVPTAPIIPVGHLPVKGDANAPVTIVEFGDFECPFCKKFFTSTFPQLKAEYIDTGKVKMYFRHLPLGSHRYAQNLANATECANNQGDFWGMHDILYEKQIIGSYNIDTMTNYAKELGLDGNEFRTCLSGKDFNNNILVDLSAARQLGATGTPSFFINGLKISGAQPFSVFQQIIEQELRS